MTTNDTRTDEQRSEAWRHDEHLAMEAERQTPFNGWENAMENAALQQKFIDGANWQAARDAEPTTVTAEQIEKAAIGLISIGLPDMPKDRAEAAVRVIFRAAEFRIEGDPA